MRNILFPSSSMCFRSVYNNHNHVSVYRICLVYWELAEMCTSLPVRGLMGEKFSWGLENKILSPSLMWYHKKFIILQWNENHIRIPRVLMHMGQIYLGSLYIIDEVSIGIDDLEAKKVTRAYVWNKLFPTGTCWHFLREQINATYLQCSRALPFPISVKAFIWSKICLNRRSIWSTSIVSNVQQ